MKLYFFKFFGALFLSVFVFTSCEKNASSTATKELTKKGSPCSADCGAGGKCEIQNGSSCYCNWLGNAVCEGEEDDVVPSVSSGSGTITDLTTKKNNALALANPAGQDLAVQIDDLIDLFGEDNTELDSAEVVTYGQIIDQVNAMQSEFTTDEIYSILGR